MIFIVIYLLYFYILMFLGRARVKNLKVFGLNGLNIYVLGRVRVSKLKFTVLM